MSRMRHKKASGGVATKDPSPSTVYAGNGSNVVSAAKERKRGGSVKVEGKKAKMRADKPCRASGGRLNPLAFGAKPA